MLPNTYYLEKHIQMQRQEMMKEARLVQLSREIKGEKPKLWQKLTWRVGDWMIDTGYRLKREQHEGQWFPQGRRSDLSRRQSIFLGVVTSIAHTTDKNI